MMSASVRSEAAATTSAALGPSDSMRMSSGPSRRNEKPRSAVSSCIEETPRSSATPSTAVMPKLVGGFVEQREAALRHREPEPPAASNQAGPHFATALWSRSSASTLQSAAARIARA